MIEDQLASQDYIVGTRYSIADIKVLPWVQIAEWSGVSLDGYPKIRAWIERCEKRTATHNGLGVPQRTTVQDRLAKAEHHASEAAKAFGFSKS